MQCNIPVLVTETLSTKWIMRDNQKMLVAYPYDVKDISKKLKFSMHQERISYGRQYSWNEAGEKLEGLLKAHLKIKP